MKLILIAIIFGLSQIAYAERFQSRIDSIDTSKTKGAPHLVKFENGRVIFIESSDRSMLRVFKKSLMKRTRLEIDVDDDNNFLAAESLTESEPKDGIETDEEFLLSHEKRSYDPTLVSSSQAAFIFQRMRTDYQYQSQCYNRAHIWTWEEFERSSIKSSKLFLFFTNRYIRNYRYKWWFHVSPMVNTSSGDRVLDRRYTSGPQDKDTWTRSFIYSGRKCPVVHRYYDYRNNQEKEDCYLIAVSMYFWQPRDIERRDRTGQVKTQYYSSEVNHAYWEAF